MRIIAVRPMEHCAADRLNLLQKRVQEQLPEGFVAVAIPMGVELFEVGASEPIHHVVAPEVEDTNTTTSSAGSDVQHADGEAADEKIRFAWVPCAHASEQQRIGAVGEHNGLCAIRLEDLTPEQQAKVDREELLVSEM